MGEGAEVKSATKPYIFTKCSLRWHEDRTIYSRSKRLLAEEVGGSLRRLGVETIDLYQIHWPNPDEEIEEGWEAMADFASRARCAGSACRISA